jgi:hypothetical protein
MTTESQKRRKSSRELEVEYLVGEIGMERHAAERGLEDEDLWIVLPEMRFAPASAAEVLEREGRQRAEVRRLMERR